jgi:hypothetical protein
VQDGGEDGVSIARFLLVEEDLARPAHRPVAQIPTYTHATTTESSTRHSNNIFHLI